MPLRDWGSALNQLTILYSDRVPRLIEPFTLKNVSGSPIIANIDKATYAIKAPLNSRLHRGQAERLQNRGKSRFVYELIAGIDKDILRFPSVIRFSNPKMAIPATR